MDTNRTKKGRKSAMLRLSDRIGDKARGALERSAIGSFFSSYDKASERFEGSSAYGAVRTMF